LKSIARKLTLIQKDLNQVPIRWELGADVVDIHAFSSGKLIAPVHHLEDIVKMY
jgi:hypothetical protein